MPDVFFKDTEGGVDLFVHVQPRARRTEIAGFHDGALKLKVAAPPVDDAANRAVIQFLAEFLGIARSRLRLVAGARSRSKTLRIQGLCGDAVMQLLEERKPHGS